MVRKICLFFCLLLVSQTESSPLEQGQNGHQREVISGENGITLGRGRPITGLIQNSLMGAGSFVGDLGELFQNAAYRSLAILGYFGRDIQNFFSRFGQYWTPQPTPIPVKPPGPNGQLSMFGAPVNY